MVPLDASALSRDLKDLAHQLSAPPGTLLHEASAILDLAVQRITEGGVLEGDDLISKFALAMQDGSLIADAFRELVSKRPSVENAERRLREYVRCPLIVPLPAEGDDQGRDGLWELSVAAFVRRAGHEPTLGAQRKPDVALASSGIRLGAEAKRLRSRAQLRNRVEKAVDQVRRNVDEGVVQAGLIALELSFAMEQHAQHGFWRLESRRNLPEVRSALRPLLNDIVHEIADIVEPCPGSQHVVGATILVLPVVAYADTRALGLVRCFMSAVFERSNRDRAAVAACGAVIRSAFADR